MTMPTNIYGVCNFLVRGNPVEPAPGDLIAQVGLLRLGDPVPEGWRVLSGNMHTSEVGRVVLRCEIEEDLS